MNIKRFCGFLLLAIVFFGLFFGIGCLIGFGKAVCIFAIAFIVAGIIHAAIHLIEKG